MKLTGNGVTINFYILRYRYNILYGKGLVKGKIHNFHGFPGEKALEIIRRGEKSIDAEKEKRERLLEKARGKKWKLWKRSGKKRADFTYVVGRGQKKHKDG